MPNNVRTTSKTLLSCLVFLIGSDAFALVVDPTDNASYQASTISIFVIVVSVTLLALSIMTFVAAILASVKGGNKRGINALIALISALISWGLAKFINWDLVAGLSIIIGVWLVIATGLIAARFALNRIFGKFKMNGQNVSATEYLAAIGSMIGAIMVVLIMYGTLAALFIGLPIAIVIKLFS